MKTLPLMFCLCLITAAEPLAAGPPHALPEPPPGYILLPPLVRTEKGADVLPLWTNPRAAGPIRVVHVWGRKISDRSLARRFPDCLAYGGVPQCVVMPGSTVTVGLPDGTRVRYIVDGPPVTREQASLALAHWKRARQSFLPEEYSLVRRTDALRAKLAHERYLDADAMMAQSRRDQWSVRHGVLPPRLAGRRVPMGTRRPVPSP